MSACVLSRTPTEPHEQFAQAKVEEPTHASGPLNSSGQDLDVPLPNRYRWPLEAANQHRHQRDVDYYLYDTLYRIGCYLGWSRLLHQEPRCLDVGNPERNRELMRLLGAVSTAVSAEAEDMTFQLWTGETWVLADLMIDPHAPRGDADRIISALRFHHEIRENPDFGRWFAPLIEDFGRFAADRNAGGLRLIQIHNALGELIMFLDPHGSDTRLSFEALPLDDASH